MLVFWSVDFEKNCNFQKEGGLVIFCWSWEKIGEKSQPPYFVTEYLPYIHLMEEILLHLGCIKPCK